MSMIKEIIDIAKEFLSWFLGDCSGLFCTLAVFTVSDWLTGTAASVADHSFSFAVNLRGLARKGCIFLLVGIAHITEANIFQTPEGLRTIVILYFLSKEGISICKNVSEIGVPVPEKLRQVLLRMEDPEPETDKKG